MKIDSSHTIHASRRITLLTNHPIKVTAFYPHVQIVVELDSLQQTCLQELSWSFIKMLK